MNRPEFRRSLSSALICLGFMAPLRADNIAQSTDFSVDTRDYGGSPVAVGGDFTVDTISESESGPAESVIFTVDTRAPSPDLAAGKSSLFTVDTRAGVAGPLLVHGTLASTAGGPVSGAWIEIKIYGQAWWRGVSGPDGSFYPPEMKAQHYVVTVQKAGYVTLAKNVAGVAGGIRTLPLVIQPLAPVPATETVVRPATTAEKTDPNTLVLPFLPGQPEPQLKIYGSESWHAVGGIFSPVINQNVMTVVLSHGWLGKPGDWPLDLAELISENNTLLGSAPNILAWDWEDAADSIAPWPDRASKQGQALGLTLRRVLGQNYVQRVHFIGHSMGTIVNRYACDAAHQAGGWDAALTKPHMTLLDEAELASVLNVRIITSATIGAFRSGYRGALREALKTTYEDWKSPIPSTPTSLIDSYISMVGIQRPNAVNVCLTGPANSGMNPIDAHSYSHERYRSTATPPYSLVLGFNQGYERGGILPPSGIGLTPGSLWRETLSLPLPLDLVLVPHPTALECNLAILNAYSIGPKTTIGMDPLETAPVPRNKVLEGYEAGIHWVGDQGEMPIIKTQLAYTTVDEKIGEGWDAANDKAGDVLNNLNPQRQINEVSRRIFQIRLGGGGGGGASAAGGGAGGPQPTTNEPGAWLTLTIPENAAMMQFDFTVNGPPVDDCVAAAVAGKNVFDLPARFAPQGEVQSTDMIDVSAYAGETVEFYFGLTGGTSTECELVIDGLRFITIPLPPLALEDHGATVSLHWPRAASGWMLEATESLAIGTWEEVIPNPGALTQSEGVMRLEETKSSTRQFYRLRRVP